MLNISAISGTGLQHPGQVGMSQSADYVSKSIQKQIEYLQKQLQELSSNDTMSMEEKQKKQQELQMQINDLTAQLRQHQMEEKKEKLESAAPSQENEEQKKMRSMLSAETALDHAEKNALHALSRNRPGSCQNRGQRIHQAGRQE